MARASNPSGGGSRKERAAKLRAEDERRQAAESKVAQQKSKQEATAADSETESDEQFDFGDEQSTGSIGTGPVGTGEYVVKQGDCIDSIAFEHGFFWETIWNDADNAELKRDRKNAFSLLPGDMVHIMEMRRKDESGATEQHHRFRQKGTPSLFRLRLLRGGEPRANEPYRLVIDNKTHEGKTDADGQIEVFIPPNADSGTLVVGEPGLSEETITINLGDLDPITEITGVQARLANLGFGCDVTRELDVASRAALAAFQKSQKMDPTGLADDSTQKQLLASHGS